MATALRRRSVLGFLILFVAVASSEAARLRSDFYKSSCPNVESIVRKAVAEKVRQTFVTVPATLRLFFHDCFVEVSPEVFLSSTNRSVFEEFLFFCSLSFLFFV